MNLDLNAKMKALDGIYGFKDTITLGDKIIDLPVVSLKLKTQATKDLTTINSLYKEVENGNEEKVEDLLEKLDSFVVKYSGLTKEEVDNMHSTLTEEIFNFLISRILGDTKNTSKKK